LRLHSVPLVLETTHAMHNIKCSRRCLVGCFFLFSFYMQLQLIVENRPVVSGILKRNGTVETCPFCFVALRCIALRCVALHCVALHCIALRPIQIIQIIDVCINIIIPLPRGRDQPRPNQIKIKPSQAKPSQICNATYLWAHLGNDSHGRATDVSGSHAKNFKVPFVTHCT